MLATPFFPPSVSSGYITPSCQTNGTHVAPTVGFPIALKPQKSSACGSGVEVSACPTAWPHAFTPKATLLVPPSPDLPRSPCHPLYQRTACEEPSARTAAPAM